MNDQPSLLDGPHKSEDDFFKNLLKMSKTIRIAVSGDVLLTKLETEIVNTREFQRLRRIKQLCTTYLVYPSAVHTRFEHSLGTLVEVSDIVSRIKSNRNIDQIEKEISSKQECIARLVALLHDIANIPFGHTLEDEMCVVDGSQDGKRLLDFINDESTIGQLIIKEAGNDAHSLFQEIMLCPKKDVGKLKENAFIFDLVKNTACADLFDYLKRDFYFCNLNLSTGDRFKSYMHIRKHEGAKRIVTRLTKSKKKSQDEEPKPKQSLMSELIQLLEARYFLAERVYFHHTKLIFSAMLGKAVWHGLESKCIDDEDLLEMGDEELLIKLQNKDDKKSNEIYTDLATAILDRKLLKIRKVISRDDFPRNALNDNLKRIDDDFRKKPEERTVLEGEIASIIKRKPSEVVIYCPETSMNLKVAEMLVEWNGIPQKFEEIGENHDPLISKKINAIKESHKNLWQAFLALPEDLDEELVRIASAWFEDRLKYGTRRQHTVKDVVNMAIREVDRDLGVEMAHEIEKELSLHFCQGHKGLPTYYEGFVDAVKNKLKKGVKGEVKKGK